MNIIFQINGGIGKCIMATAVCEAIHKQHPKANLIVVSGYADVFLNNPNVYRTYNFNGFSYFYDEFVKDKEVLLFAHDPYLETNHLKQNEHLIKTWCELYGIEYNGELPKIHLTAREIKFFENRFQSDLPILLLQTNGGSQTEHKYSWARDIPSSVAIKVIDAFRKDYNIIHIKREDQIGYDYTYAVTDTFRALCVLNSLSKKRLFVDSFAQHTAAAMDMPSTVCWIANKPEVFGYNMHDNITANPFTVKPELRNSFLQQFNIAGDLLEFPYSTEDEIFDVDKIIESIKNQK